eukprot:c1788_g1_i1.p1 GENE.c1788_g1_i1~~c1788_g1_i1.p1  ORF type:complete len:512 (+),score=96.69 c1788_g1_i1:86-1621(+)
MNLVEARNAFQSRFRRAIKDFHSIHEIWKESLREKSHVYQIPFDIIGHIIHTGFSPLHVQILHPLVLSSKHYDQDSPIEVQLNSFRVCARKRACADDAQEYDCVTCTDKHTMIVHDGRLHRNGRATFMLHHPFDFDRVFNENEDNDVVFRETALPLLRYVLDENHSATVLMFGQTGTGKTYTTYGIQERLAREIFEGKDVKTENEVVVICYEMMGTKSFDLLNERKPVSLLQGYDGRVHVRGAKEPHVHTKEDLMDVFTQANALRAVRSLERNHQSSRSHAVCIISFSNGCSLSLVDLAGSERHLDTLSYSATDHIESADINTALMTLKECFRSHASHSNQRVPFRAHPLTQVLRECFENEFHRSVLLATVSSQSSDIDHTLNTIKHVMHMRPVAPLHKNQHVKVECLMSVEEKLEEELFVKWDMNRVHNWLKQVEDGRFVRIAAAGLDGRQLLHLPQERLTTMLGGDAEGAGRLFRLVREESGRITKLVEARRASISKLLKSLPGSFVEF